jgi:hypothetical protein
MMLKAIVATVVVMALVSTMHGASDDCCNIAAPVATSCSACTLSFTHCVSAAAELRAAGGHGGVYGLDIV